MRKIKEKDIINKIEFYGMKNTVISIWLDAKRNRTFKIIENGKVKNIKIIKDGNQINILCKLEKKSKKVQFIVYEFGKEILKKDIKHTFTKKIRYINSRIQEKMFKTSEYCWNKNVGIEKIELIGFDNLIFRIVGSVSFKDCKYIIKADGKLIEYKVFKQKKENSFWLEARLPKKIQKVQFFVEAEGSEQFILEKKIHRKEKMQVKYNKILKRTRFNYNKNIGIENATITGIKNALFKVWGSVDLEECKYIVKADGKVVESTEGISEGKYRFCVEAKLPKHSRKIEFYLQIANKEYCIIEKRNSLYRRTYEKVSYELKKRTNILRNVNTIIFRGIKFLWKEHHFLVPIRLWKKYLIDFKNKINTKNPLYNPMIQQDYLNWIKEFEKRDDVLEKFSYNPLVSIVIPVYNVSRKLLTECLDSILNQNYTNFEICLADDCSTNKETLKTLKEYEEKYDKVKVVYRKENGHISKTTNSAIEIAKGEFIGLMDNDDVITKDALYEIVKVLNKDRKIDFIYSDEDKLDLEGIRCQPHFKPDYSPDTLLSSNYLCHFTVMRKTLIEEVGGFEEGLEGSQDYDLFLKIVEKTDRIYHIPKILYHWRMVKGSTSMKISGKSYAIERGKRTVENALKRRNIKGEVQVGYREATCYKIKYLYEKEPKISIIIPTRDYASTLKTCLDSLYELTKYSNYEVIIMNNQSKEEETFELFNYYKKNHKNFRVIDVNTRFNYSNINNIGVKESTGEYILLLNNDTEILQRDWLSIMVGYAMQEHIGTVGVKLYYPDMTVQHAGVVIGLGGVAGHSFIGYPKEDYGLYARLKVPYNYSANTAACLMVSKEKFLEVGGLEESLEVAYNDVDFNLKILEKGYYNVNLPQVELMHFESKSRGLDSTNEKYKRFLNESEFMYEKWKIKETNDRFYNPNFSLRGSFLLEKK